MNRAGGHYFSFDYRAYREWTAKAVIRIDDDEPDLYTFAPGSRTAGDNKAAAKKEIFLTRICVQSTEREVCTATPDNLHTFPGTPGIGDREVALSGRDPGASVNIMEHPTCVPGSSIKGCQKILRRV